jgi:hypothetical protein
VSRTVYVDNTAPASPIGAALSGGTGWKAANAFGVAWSDPTQAASPIAGADFSICPAANAPGDQRGCVQGSRDAANIASLSNVTVPGPGTWSLVLHLRDAAGNSDARTSVVVSGLRYDPTPPNAQFEPILNNDPTRVGIAASDDVSDVASAELEIQRNGTNTWLDVPLTRTPDGFTASIDDRALRKGNYRIRARVVDEAGNERTIDTFPSGKAAQIALPIRLRTALAVGKVERVRARGSRAASRATAASSSDARGPGSGTPPRCMAASPHRAATP